MKTFNQWYSDIQEKVVPKESKDAGADNSAEARKKTKKDSSEADTKAKGKPVADKVPVAGKDNINK